MIKHSAKKIRRLYQDKILAGFAGSTADAFSLFGRFEAKLEQYAGNLGRSAVELAKDWRTDKMLRHLEALLMVADLSADLSAQRKGRRDRAGRGDCGDRQRRVVCAGGGAGADGEHGAGAREIAEKALTIAGQICIYTNEQITIEELNALRAGRANERPKKEQASYGDLFTGNRGRPGLALDELTPREIVAELDKYVVGQHAAKRAVAIALRNRMRRQKLSPELADEIMPKNIIMIGPTGVGKTEIARRLAKLTNSPFLKVEASKFTEVGYVGRDVESMVRDLVEIAIDMVREEKLEDVEDKAEMNAEERLLDLLLPPPTPAPASSSRPARDRTGVPMHRGQHAQLPGCERRCAANSHGRTREKLRQQFREGKLDERMVEMDVRERNTPAFEIISQPGHRRHGHQLQGHAAEHLWPAHEEAEDEGCARRSSTWCRKKSSG